MPPVTEVRTLILVHGSELRGPLEALARTLPWASARGLEFIEIHGDAQHAASEARARDASNPIGVLAAHESTVLAALAGGADEAAVVTEVSAAALAAFVDRLHVRAQLRAERQRLHETFAHAERLTALGTLVAGIGHEINNPLAVMLLSIEAARRYVLPASEAACELARCVRLGEPIPEDIMTKLSRLETATSRGRDAARILDDIAGAADSIASIVRDLRVFARADEGEPPELVEVQDLVDQSLRLVSRELFQYALIERDYEPNLPKLVLPRNRVAQVMINLLINAAHAMRDVERPDHRVRISARADESFVALVVSDTGPGIPAESIERIFDPFFTTKRQEMGTGLGLAISRSILRELGGDLTVESVYGEGATFLCFLPIPSRETMGIACNPQITTIRRVSSPPPAAYSVLVVEDDERMLRSYTRLLNPTHRLMIAPDGRDAIELLQSGSTPDAVLLELDLPGTDGRKLLAWLAEHRPALHARALVVTSAGSQARYEDFLRSYAGAVLHKPVRGEVLLAEIARLLAS